MAVNDKSIEEKYKKYKLRDHVYNVSDTYVGSCESTKINAYVFDNNTNKMINKEISYVPGLLKIFDEVIVNAIDHATRLKMEEKNGKENIKHVKNIKITINKETGYISVFNDGNGIDIVKHPEHDNIWIPEMIFSELLTSTNYDKNEEKIIGGKGGLGTKLCNIFSKEFKIETVDHYRKKIYKQIFRNNMIDKDPPEISSYTKIPYTIISFLPDYKRFGLTGITDDIYDIFKRRVIDACSTTSKDVSVFFNDEKLPIKDFEKFSELFLNKTEQPLVYEQCGERWEIAIAPSSNGIFEQISFVNGINTLRGGKHVDYILNQVVKGLVDMTLSKKKKTIKAQHIKDNIMIFVKATIVNPAFDSQSKETLTTAITKFGSTCSVSDKFIDKLYKTGIIDKALSLTEVQDQKKLVKTDGKKISKIIVPKLDDANLAGTKNSAECTLILTEGDSAKTMAITGLSVVGRDRYGVFPLRGKIMNVKDATLQKISDNAEITAIKKILGLEQNKTYKDLSSLRYGSIMIMTDQDHDGSHIKGLLFNIFQSMWSSLYKMDGFISSMLTPIIKASNSKNEVIEFYNMSDYEKWSETDIAKKGWKIKYYKGLGTSNDQEAKEYFKNMKKITYKYTEQSDEHIDLAFNKKRADDRKEWLSNYNKTNILDYTNYSVNYETFIDKELIHFSNRDLQRSINHLCDGLKESTRKILFACFKRKLYTNEIKVAQLSGYVSEVSAYHHGEASLQQAIVGMAQIFVGNNNINLLVPNGQFGSRTLSNGSDASSPRYIYTLLSKLSRTIFREDDINILNYQEDDGQQIEPEYYIPIIPMILVNGGLGIGTGYSTNVPQFNPTDLINISKLICEAIKIANIKTETEEDLERIYDTIDLTPIDELVPYYLGFKGVIEKNEKDNYVSKGIYNWTDDNTVEITELPIGTWTDDYKEYLENMIVNGTNSLKSIENHYTSKNIRFILHFNTGAKQTIGDKFETLFKLSSSKNLNMNNMHLFSEKGAIKRYDTTTDIIKEWAEVRIRKYFERKNYKVKILEKDFNILSAKIKFITDVIEGRIIIMNKKLTEVAVQLENAGYSKIYKDDNDSSEVETDDNIKGYRYLISMPISQLTYDRKLILEKEVEELNNKLNNLKNTNIEDIWLTELMELEEAWKEHKETIELDYENDKNGIVNKSGKAKTTKVVKKKK